MTYITTLVKQALPASSIRSVLLDWNALSSLEQKAIALYDGGFTQWNDLPLRTREYLRRHRKEN